MTKGLRKDDARTMKWLAKHRELMSETERTDPRRLARYQSHANRIYQETNGQNGWEQHNENENELSRS